MHPLIKLIPPRLVRLFARPYVAGASLAAAMEAARRIYAKDGLMTTLDLLAEGIQDQEQAEGNEREYMSMIDAVAESRTDFALGEAPTVSLKPSSYTVAPLEKGGDARGAREAIFRLVDYAAQRGVDLSIDMEDRHWTDYTLTVLRDIHAAGYRHVGGVLQTCLERTRRDLDELPEGMRVRLVIGIYREPESVATQDKAVMKERLLEYGGQLLARGHYVEFATHDEAVVRRFVDEVVTRVGVGTDRYEIQMLYGVPRSRLLAELRRRGIRRRLYVPYALSWSQAIRYLRRRLDEYPAMMFLVFKNLIWRK